MKNELAVKSVGEMTMAETFLHFTNLELGDIKKAFFKIGFRLCEAESLGYYKELGYENIYELAEKEFGFKTTSTKNLMAINRRFSEGTGRRMQIAEDYQKFSQSQLVEMVSIADNDLISLIKPSYTIEQIRYVKKAYHRYGGWCCRCRLEDEGLDSLIKRYQQDYEIKSQKASSEVAEGQIQYDDNLNIVDAHNGEMVKPVELVEEIEEDEELADVYSHRETKEPAPLKDEEWDVEDDEQEEPEEREEFNPAKYVMSKEEFASAFTGKEKIEKPAVIPKHNFKNKKEREEFIHNHANYNVMVLTNQELNLTIKRLDLANGAKIYLTIFLEFSAYHKKPVERVKYCLVDSKGYLKPIDLGLGKMIYPSTYTLEGTAPTYILDYLTKHKDEI